MTDMEIQMLETVVRKSEVYEEAITFEKGSSQGGHSTHDGIDVLVVDENGNGNGDYVRLYDWEKVYRVTGN